MAQSYILRTFSVLISNFLLVNVCISAADSSYFFYQLPEYPRDCQEVLDQCSTQTSSSVYLIKPDGYNKPFEIFCDSELDGGGWTVIQRRNSNDSLQFGRNWEDYREGFGFLGSEFWIGNEKLSFLTNQKKYELRIDMVNSSGSLFYITYDFFRISDEFTSYRLASVGQYNGMAAGFTLDGQTSTITTPGQPTDCQDVFTDVSTTDGVYTIKPAGWSGTPFEVYCNMSHGGGWTVLQRRVNGSVGFYRNWTSYKEGFGTPGHELWLGNDKFYYLTNQRKYKLRIDLVNGDGVNLLLSYDLFRVSDQDGNYQLHLGNYTGNAGYDFMDHHRNQSFSTFDNDNDNCPHYYYCGVTDCALTQFHDSFLSTQCFVTK